MSIEIRPKRQPPKVKDFEIGADIAKGGGTMNMVLTRDSEPRCESNLICSRLVAAAGPLLNYWTDFGRLIT